MIEFKSVTKTYPGDFTALDNISFKIERGEMVFLKGHSGAGKSSLLKLIALLEAKTKGVVLVNGKDVSKIKSHYQPYYKRQLGVIFQNPLLLNEYSIFENVAMPLIIAGFDRFDIKKRVRAALNRVGLHQKDDLKPMMLSTGEQQRVGIARAIVHKPKLLLADEPTGNLDPALSIEIIQLFERFNQVGVTVLLATHENFVDESRPNNRILTLKEGKIISDTGTRANLSLGQEQHGA